MPAGRVNGDKRFSRHRPYEDPLFMRFLTRAENCEAQGMYYACEGCAVRHLCESFLDAIGDIGAYRIKVSSQAEGLFLKIMDALFAWAGQPDT